MTFFISLICVTFVNFTLSPPCYLLKIKNYEMKEKKIFVRMAASAYIISRR